MKLVDVSDIFESEENRQDKLQELFEEMDRTAAICESLDNSIFPDFMWEPIQNEFEDDNYLERGVVDNEDMQAVRMLRRKYSNYYDYIEAVQIYENYMEKIIAKYPSYKFLKNGVQLGIIEEFIPPEPKLKMKKENKLLINSDACICRTDEVVSEFFSSSSRDTIEQMYPETAEMYSEFPDEAFEMKKIPNEIKRQWKDQERRERKKGIYINYRGAADTDAIIEFMNNGGSIRYDQKGKKSENNSISAIIDEMHKYDYMPPELVEMELEANTSKVIGGRLVNRDEQDKIEVMSQLMSIGFISSDTARSSLGKTGFIMARQKAGLTGAEGLTKKERKKLKKRQKKEKKRLQKTMESDSRMERILKQNKMSYSRDSETMSFKLKDLYND